MGFWIPLAMAGAGLAAGALANRKKKSSGGGGYEFKPYSGPEPAAPNYLRPSESLTYQTISKRSQGEDVGYDPARMEAQRGLLGSQIDKRLSDDVREMQGMAGRAGLGGNLRAQEALEGRARRDASRTYGEGLMGISIENLARANQERDINTDRLQRFNEFQFGQDRAVADFNLRKWAQEQGLQSGESQFASQLALQDRARQDEMFSDLLGTGVNVGRIAMGDYSAAAPLVLNMASQGTGYGAAPGASGAGQPDFNKALQSLTNMRRDPYFRRKTGGF